MAGFFGFWGNCWAIEKNIIISEVFYNSMGKKWIELYNNSNSPIGLVGYELTASSGNYFVFPDNFILSNKKYVTIYWNCDGENIASDLYTGKSTFNISGYVALFNSHTHSYKTILDYMEYGKGEQTWESAAVKAGIWKEGKYIKDVLKKDYSVELILSKNEEDFINNWQESFCIGGSPGKESTQQKDCLKIESTKENEIKNYSGKLKINEIFPAPKTKNDGKEFVEIVNVSSESINLSGMRIEDEKNHKVYFPEKILAPVEIYFLEGKIELNNTSPDTAFLIDKDGDKNNPIDSASYDHPKYDYSYAFNGSAWQWTNKITEGTENQFDEILSGEIKKDKKIYAGVYAYFEAKAGDNAKKFTWNFGDGHKSYLQKTRHKYEKSGDYSASLKITGDGEENILNFIVAVENFKKTKVQIVGFSANPAGKDSENEWVEVRNNTKKKVNLKNWSVATGWKNLYNHPIKKDFIIKPKETKKLTRDFCAFALGNKQAKIELRYPNGKTADKIKYDRKKDSVDEDEVYQKERGNWQWITTPTNTDMTPTNTDETRTNAENNMEEEKIFENIEPSLDDMEIDLSDLGKYSADPNQKNKQKKQIALLFTGSNIIPEEKLLQSHERVLGISATKKDYAKPTGENNSPNFMNKIWKKINAKMSRVVNAF